MKSLVLFLIASVLLVGCSTGFFPTKSPTSTQVSPTSTPTVQAQDLSAKLDNALRTTISGSVLIAENGQVLLDKGYGLADRTKNIPNTSQTRFRIYSMSRQFTAMAILMLQEQGKLTVQDSICKFLDKCPESWNAITIHHLLTSTSGIPDMIWPHLIEETPQEITSTAPLERSINDVKTKPLDYQPGSLWFYNQTGYVLLGKIIEKVSGQSYEEFLKKNIFEPLHMENTGYDHNRNDLAIGYINNGADIAEPINMETMFSGAGLYSTVEDLYLWDQALYTDKLLPQNVIETMFSPYVLLDANMANSASYGYGWVVGTNNHRRVDYHPGGYKGYRSVIKRYPDENTTVIILMNQQDINPIEEADLVTNLLFAGK